MTTGVWQSETEFNPTNIEDLTDGGSTILHYHASDRSRANHTGTQLASTISDFQAAVDSNTNLIDLTDGDVTTLHKHDIVTDTTPKLGGNLDCQGFMILNSRTTADVYGFEYDMLTDVITPGYVISGVFLPVNYSGFPVQEKLGRGLLTSAGAWTKLNATDTTKYPDGSAAVLDGSAGQVMVQIPSFYQVIMTDNNKQYFLISDDTFTFKSVTAWIPLGFREQPYRYCGAFQATAATDATTAAAQSIIKDTIGYTTNAYPNPFSNRGRYEFRTQCANGVFHQFDWGLFEITRILFFTEYKNWNSQKSLPGFTEIGTWNYAQTEKAGDTLSLGDMSGSIWDATNSRFKANSYRGIENIFGNINTWIDGINVDNTDSLTKVYVNYDPATWAEATATGYIDTGHSPGLPASTYIKYLKASGQYCPFFSALLGGTSSTYVTDLHSNSNGSWKAVRCGGDISSLAGAGAASIGSSDSGVGSERISARVAA